MFFFKPKTIVTHNGIFHTDDIFAVAVLLLKFPGSKVIRTRDREVISKADMVTDVGHVYDPKRLRFDHHQQVGAEIRGNGVPYASFGMVWKEFGESLAGLEAAAIIEEKLVIPVDAPDNGVSVYEQVFENIRPYTIGDFFYSYIINGNSGHEYLYETFMKIVDIAKDLLEREIAKAQERVEGMKKVRDILESTEDKRIIILEKDLPWEPVLVPLREPMFVVYKRREGNWGVKAVPSTVKGFEVKKSLPLAWAGTEEEDLQKITGVSDAIFCHKARFLAAAKSREGALRLAEMALKQ